MLLQIIGKDFLCVQSFDGQLSFFDQDHFIFARFLTTSLVPGPICYCKATDSFITYNSSMELEAYKYFFLSMWLFTLLDIDIKF